MRVAAMTSRFLAVSTILGLGTSIVFGVIGIRHENLHLGWYFAILVVAIVLIFIFFFYEFVSLTDQLHSAANALVAQHTSLSRAIKAAGERKIVIYVNSFANFATLASHKLYSRSSFQNTDVYICPAHEQTDFDSEKFRAVSARFNTVYLTPTRLSFNFLFAPINDAKPVFIVAQPDSLDFSDSISVTSALPLYDYLTDIVSSTLQRTSVAAHSLCSVDWLISHLQIDAKTKAERDVELGSGRLRSRSPQEIYQEQIALSRGAKTVLALDMTEPGEWKDTTGLGRCLIENQRSATLPGADIRRIFICPSRATWINNSYYRDSITDVIKAHVEHGLGAGIVFQEELKDPHLIRDTVLYDNKVLWVETVPTTRYSGEGYFTSDLDAIARHRQLFERLWDGEFSEKPSVAAASLLESGNESCPKTIDCGSAGVPRA